jgi:hypothetical protein
LLDDFRRLGHIRFIDEFFERKWRRSRKRLIELPRYIIYSFS